MNEVMERVAMLFSCCAIVRIAKGLLWLKVSSEWGYMSSLEMEQRLFVCACVVFLLVFVKE